jgi:carbonic anhydrase
VPETTVLNLQPGDVFVHRNIANIVSPTDINSQAVIEYAVAHLKVKHIVLCGHTCCGGAGAALGESKVGGVLDTWIAPLKQIAKRNKAELQKIEDDKQRAVRLAELNVMAGVEILLSNYVVEEAIRTRGLSVHGCIYDIASGRLRDLEVGNAQVAKGVNSVGQ